MERLSEVPGVLNAPLAATFSQWSQQMQELYQLYYDLLVMRDTANDSSVKEAAEVGLRQVMLTLTNSLENLKNAPPSSETEALNAFLDNHYQLMQEVSMHARSILEKGAAEPVYTRTEG